MCSMASLALPALKSASARALRFWNSASALLSSTSGVPWARFSSSRPSLRISLAHFVFQYLDGYASSTAMASSNLPSPMSFSACALRLSNSFLAAASSGSAGALVVPVPVFLRCTQPKSTLPPTFTRTPSQSPFVFSTWSRAPLAR